MHNTERVKELSCNHAENKDTINEKNNVDWGGLWGVRVQCEEKQTRKTP